MSKASITRDTFAAASFQNLRAATGEVQAAELRIPLAAIDEDPAQPRTVFDEVELARLAESIRKHGVVQPVVVRPAVGGRYMLVCGARRVRASRLAGVPDVPAVVRGTGEDFSVQIVENQHRANLANSDLAAAIDRLASEGRTNKDIEQICGMKSYQVAAFRQVRSFPPELRERLDASDVRALYDLYRQWKRTPAEVLDALPDPESAITITEARRIIAAITGKPTGSVVLSKAGEDGHNEDESEDEPETPREKKTRPVFLVRSDDGRVGRLIVSRRADGDDLVLVKYDTGVEEASVEILHLVGVE